MEIRHTILTARVNATMGFSGINVRLRVARITSGRSVAQIAEIVSLDPSTIYKYENARIDYPAPDRLFAIADATGVSAYWLMSGLGKPTENEERNEVIRYWLESITAEVNKAKAAI